MDNCERALVILGTEYDEHVSRVRHEIEKHRDTKVFVLDYLRGTRFTLSVSEEGSVRILAGKDLLPRNCLVWDRTKILPGTSLYIQGVDETSAGYVAQEWRALSTLLCGLKEGQVVNSLASRQCRIKPYQQVMAASAGLAVPKTLVTNDKRKALIFHRNSPNGLVMKSVSAGKVKPTGDGGDYIPYNVMTMRVSENDIAMASEQEMAYCPHFFQLEIKKDYELRIVVVGDHVLPFRINSQKHRTTEIDWRKGIQMVEFIPCEISAEIRSKIVRFMANMGFFSGSIDIVVDQSGKHWFLECNQDGAWGWLDDIVQGRIARAFADALSKKIDVLMGSSMEA